MCVSFTQETRHPDHRRQTDNQISICSLPLVGDILKAEGFSSASTDIVLSSWKDSTQKQYKTYITKWVHFCNTRNINPKTPVARELIEFLTELFLEGLGYSALNTAKSAVVNCTLSNLGTNQYVTRFMKGAFIKRPILPKNQTIWDTDIVLQWIRRTSPVKDLDLKDLTLKLVILMALLSGQRVQTLHMIRLENMLRGKQGVTITFSDLLKTSRPGKHQKQIFLAAYPPDRRLCIMTVLKEYDKRTEELRKGQLHDKLLISFVKPHKPVTAATIARWIKTVLKAAGIDMSIFTAHSTRSAATSAAARASVPITTILDTAGWFNCNTFNKFYNKPVTTRNSFSLAILDKEGRGGEVRKE